MSTTLKNYKVVVILQMMRELGTLFATKEDFKKIIILIILKEVWEYKRVIERELEQYVRTVVTGFLCQATYCYIYTGLSVFQT